MFKQLKKQKVGDMRNWQLEFGNIETCPHKILQFLISQVKKKQEV